MARAAAWLAMAQAVAVLVCWRTGWAAPGMRPLTALCLIPLAVSALLLAGANEERSSPVASVLAAVGACAGFGTLLEYLMGVDSGAAGRVAAWFSAQPMKDPRLSPVTAVGLGLEGMALLALGSAGTRRQSLGQWLGLASLGIAILALVGHSFGVSGFYQVGPHAGMALSTAIGMLLVGLAAIFTRPLVYPAGLFCVENLGGFVARRVVPAAILFPILTGWLRFAGERADLYETETGAALLVVTNMLFFTVLVGSVAYKLAILDRQRSESGALLRGTLEGTEDFVAVLDPDYRWVAFNDAHRREFHAIYGRDPVRGASMLESMIVPEDVDAGRKIWGRALAGESFRITHEFGDPARARKWYELRFTPIRNAAGRIIAAAQIVRDMTAWHDARESLRNARDLAERSHAQQQAIVQSMAEGVLVFDPQGMVVDANRNGLAMLGYASLGALREAVADASRAFDVRDADGRVQPFESWPISRALRGETFTNFELLVRWSDGSHPVFIDFGGAPVRDPSGAIAFAVLTMRDITKEREAEQQLALAREQLQAHAADLEHQVRERTARLTESLHEMERFSYSLSHDMRAPLRAMKGFSQILAEEYADKLGASGKNYLDRIAAAAGRLDQLIQDVLTYSRIVRDRIKLEPVDVEQLTRQLIDENPALQAPVAEVVTEGRLAPVLGHVAYLTQVLTNLLGNAVKFVAPGKKPRVKIWSTAAGQKIRLYIQDNGIGIAKEAQGKLFAMFQRLNPSYEGTGIGLNIVRKAVERMGGTVGVESEPGHGTTFWVELEAAPTP